MVLGKQVIRLLTPVIPPTDEQIGTHLTGGIDPPASGVYC